MKGLKKKLPKFSRKFWSSLKGAWPILVIVLVVASFFWKTWFKGQVPIPGDFVVGVYFPWLDYKWGYSTGVPVKNPITTDVPSFTYPMQTYVGSLIKEGKLPLWNPLILAGTPLLANFQSAPFTVLINLLTDAVSAWSFQIVFQHLLAGIFTYFLLRSWKVSKFGSTFGGVVFAFSGFNLIWSQWNGHTLAAAFIPLILLFQDKFLLTGRLKYAFGFCLSLALQILSGYPQVVFYTGTAVVLLSLVRFKVEKLHLKSILLLAFGFLALGLTSFQLFPGAELLKYSQREIEPHPFEWAFLPPKKIITFLAPDFFGNHATKNYWGPQDYTSNTGFVGVVAFSLGLLSLGLIKKNKSVLYLFLLTGTSLILAFPTPVSIFLWKKGFLGLNAASAHRSLVLWNLGVAVLAGFGLDALQSKFKSKYKWFLIFPFTILVGYGLYAFKIHQTVGLRNLILPTAAFLGVAFIVLVVPRLRLTRALTGQAPLILILISVLELFYFGWKFTPFSPRYIVFPATPILEFLMSQKKPFRVTGSRIIPINMKMPYGLETVEGYDAVYPLRTAQFMAALNGGKSGTDPLGRYATVDNDTSPLLDLLNTKYYLTLDPVPSRFTTDRFREVFRDKSVVILESKNALPRSFYVDKWEVIGQDSKIIDRLLDPKFNFAKTIILEEEPPDGTKGFIFTSETFYPGWKAYADELETKIYRANFAFRAVPVSSPETKVEYRYEPASFSTGFKISAVSLVLLLLLVLKLRR